MSHIRMVTSPQPHLSWSCSGCVHSRWCYPAGPAHPAADTCSNPDMKHVYQNQETNIFHLCFFICSSPCPWARPCTEWGCWPECPPSVRGQEADARWRSSLRPAQCPHWAPDSGPGACGQPASDVTWWQYTASSTWNIHWRLVSWMGPAVTSHRRLIWLPRW